MHLIKLLEKKYQNFWGINKSFALFPLLLMNSSKLSFIKVVSFIDGNKDKFME